jgi:hypothetical protein
MFISYTRMLCEFFKIIQLVRFQVSGTIHLHCPSQKAFIQAYIQGRLISLKDDRPFILKTNAKKCPTLR